MQVSLEAKLWCSGPFVALNRVVVAASQCAAVAWIDAATNKDDLVMEIGQARVGPRRRRLCLFDNDELTVRKSFIVDPRRVVSVALKAKEP